MIFFSIFIALGCVAVGLRYYFRENYTWKEFGLGMGILFAVIGIGYLIASHAQVADTQILSGKVISKKQDRVSCRHSYQCNCHMSCSSSGKSEICTTECDTCYEHSFDYDWDVKSTVGEFTIDSIDRQGLRQPPRWTSVVIGEPASVAVSYDNWLKAVPDSVFRRTTEEKLPDYPSHIYDYYHVDRVVVDDFGAGGRVVVDDIVKGLNQKIAQGLIDRGKEKQVNLVIVLTRRASNFAQELRAGWLNGKKNDLVVVIGMGGGTGIDWVDVFGWSSNDLVNVRTRDDIREHGIIDDAIVDIALENIDKYWQRRPMQEYEYLKDEIQISSTAIIVLLILGGIIIVGSAIVFNKEEIL